MLLLRRRGLQSAAVGEAAPRETGPGPGPRHASGAGVRPSCPFHGQDRRVRDRGRRGHQHAVPDRVREGNKHALPLAPRSHAHLGAVVAPLRAAARFHPGASPAHQDVVRAAVAAGISFAGRSVRPGAVAAAGRGPRREVERRAAGRGLGHRVPAHPLQESLAHEPAGGRELPGAVLHGGRVGQPTDLELSTDRHRAHAGRDDRRLRAVPAVVPRPHRLQTERTAERPGGIASAEGAPGADPGPGPLGQNL